MLASLALHDRDQRDELGHPVFLVDEQENVIGKVFLQCQCTSILAEGVGEGVLCSLVCEILSVFFVPFGGSLEFFDLRWRMAEWDAV